MEAKDGTIYLAYSPGESRVMQLVRNKSIRREIELNQSYFHRNENCFIKMREPKLEPLFESNHSKKQAICLILHNSRYIFFKLRFPLK